MKKTRVSAVMAERLFGVVILLLLGGLVIDFIFVTDFLKTESSKTEVLKQQAEASDSNLAKLKSTNTWLNQHQDIIKRTDALVAQSKLYQYQNQIIEDFYSYGTKAGVGISGFTFLPPSTTTGAATPAATTPAPAGATPVPATKVPTGVNSITVTINFAPKVPYKNFLDFLKLLEQNVTRMQITNVNLTPDTENLQVLSAPTATIIVYTR